tara:strand:+ start:388 stop:648 length:261 start_codon:yes stop_codon:yes gene_type:complete
MKSISIETYSKSSATEVKEGDTVRVVYPKMGRSRSPHRTDGIYKVLQIDAFRDIYWVKYLRDSKKITVVKRSYIQAVVNSNPEESN